jgi:hypothetical protein
MWMAAVMAIVLAVLEWRGGRVHAVAAMPVMGPTPAPPRIFAADSLARSSSYVAENDPFRTSRQPPSIPYSPSLEGLAPPPVARAPRPNFILRGIVGGPPWSAIVEGVPGRSGAALLRKGDSLGDLVVRLVTRDTVVIKGADTTWRLTMRRTW